MRYKIKTALKILSSLTDTLVSVNISAVLVSACWRLETRPPPLRLSAPHDNGDEHLNTGCLLSTSSCIIRRAFRICTRLLGFDITNVRVVSSLSGAHMWVCSQDHVHTHTNENIISHDTCTSTNINQSQDHVRWQEHTNKKINSINFSKTFFSLRKCSRC